MSNINPIACLQNSLPNRAAFLISLSLIASCGSGESTEPPTTIITVGMITWSDGDSGRLDDMPFRLKDVDAPETGATTSQIGAAECVQERNLGLLAEEFIVALTANAAIAITRSYGADRFGREVVDLSADGIDVGNAGIEAGHLRPWPHDSSGNALSEKPDWCS